MKPSDWIKIASVAIPILGSVAFAIHYNGNMEGRIEELSRQVSRINLDKIAEAEKQAVDRLKNFATGSVLKSRNYHVWVSKGKENETEMIAVDEGICYLTHMDGHFESGGDAVWIDIRGGSWYLAAKSRQGDINVRARCWKWPSMEREDE